MAELHESVRQPHIHEEIPCGMVSWTFRKFRESESLQAPRDDDGMGYGYGAYATGAVS